MCDPMTIAGVALSAGSMLMNQAAAGKVDKARGHAMMAENERQQRLRRESDALNEASRDRYDDFGGKQEAKAKSLGEYFAAQNKALPSDDPNNAPIPTSASNIVVNEQKKQQDKVSQFTDQQAMALGNLRGFGDLLGDTSRLQSRDAAQIGTIGGFMRGSQNVLPLELEASNSKGAGQRLFGDILGGAGQIGIGAGLSGAKLPIFGTAKVSPQIAAGVGPGTGLIY